MLSTYVKILKIVPHRRCLALRVGIGWFWILGGLHGHLRLILLLRFLELYLLRLVSLTWFFINHRVLLHLYSLLIIKVR